jgi:hypothetical protein
VVMSGLGGLRRDKALAGVICMSMMIATSLYSGNPQASYRYFQIQRDVLNELPSPQAT